jgi:hypothetical protein
MRRNESSGPLLSRSWRCRGTLQLRRGSRAVDEIGASGSIVRRRCRTRALHPHEGPPMLRLVTTESTPGGTSNLPRPRSRGLLIWEDRGVDDEVQRRVAANEAALRRVNEAIERGRWPARRASEWGFAASAPEWAAIG